MNCNDASQLLIDLAYGDLDSDQRTLVDAHLAECFGCREKYEKMTIGLSFLNNDTRSLQESVEPLNVTMVLASPDVGAVVENSSPTGVTFDRPATPLVRRSRVATAIRVCSTACSVGAVLLVVVAATVVFAYGRLELSDRGIWIAWNESSESREPTSAEREETQVNLQRMTDLEATLERQSKETQLVRRQLAVVARVLQTEDELRRDQMSRLEGRLLSIEERGNTRWKTLSRLLTASTESTAAGNLANETSSTPWQDVAVGPLEPSFSIGNDSKNSKPEALASGSHTKLLGKTTFIVLD